MTSISALQTSQKLPGFTAEASLGKSSRYYAAAWTSANRMSGGEIIPQVSFRHCRCETECECFCCDPQTGNCNWIDFC